MKKNNKSKVAILTLFTGVASCQSPSDVSTFLSNSHQLEEKNMEVIEPMRPYADNNLFTYSGRWKGDQYVAERLPAPGPPNGYEQFDLAIIETDEEGDFANPLQLEIVSDRIRSVRKGGGAIVVSFIHGWHNNADWDNANLESFRKLLKALMVRELEAHNRRVIGVYVGWNGRHEDGIGKWIGRIPGIKHATFKDRYRAAARTGKGDALSETLVELTSACKMDVNSSDSTPLILVGHSMGAFILQSTFRELLGHSDNPLVVPSHQGNEAITTATSDHPAVSAPDLLLSLNSASESDVAKDIIQMMREQGWKKRFKTSDAGVNVAPYNPPFLVSVTSSEDKATNWIWRAGHFFQKPSTDGHDQRLATHEFSKSNAKADCQAADYPDFGQPWHCLHKDAGQRSPTPRFRIDLPDHDRSSDDSLSHTAYDLIPKDPYTPAPFWLFQVSGNIVEDHSDIFNYRAASFTLALIQMSGVLASAAGDGWAANFSEVMLD